MRNMISPSLSAQSFSLENQPQAEYSMSRANKPDFKRIENKVPIMAEVISGVA